MSGGRLKAHLAGFTLIELMVVVIVIGIMTAMVLPEMRGTYGDTVLRSASRDLVDACGIASSRAVSFCQEHRLRLDPVEGRYVVERRIGAPNGEESFVPVRDVPGSTGKMDGRLTFRILPPAQGSNGEAAGAAENPEEETSQVGGGDGVGFYPDGTSDGGQILLRDRDGFRLALRINPITARVRVIPMQRE